MPSRPIKARLVRKQGPMVRSWPAERRDLLTIALQCAHKKGRGHKKGGMGRRRSVNIKKGKATTTEPQRGATGQFWACVVACLRQATGQARRPVLGPVPGLCMGLCMACAWPVHGPVSGLCLACVWPVSCLCPACVWPVHGPVSGLCMGPCLARAWALACYLASCTIPLSRHRSTSS